MKYRVTGQSITYPALYERNRKRGRRPSQRLAVIMHISNLTLSDIARIYAANRDNHTIRPIPKGVNCVVTRTNLSHVLAGRDNSPDYIKAIETAWKLPISEIRKIYNEDKTRKLSEQELREFQLHYMQTHFPEQYSKFQELQLFGGIAA